MKTQTPFAKPPLYGMQRLLSNTTPYKTNPLFLPSYAAGRRCKFPVVKLEAASGMKQCLISFTAAPMDRTVEAEKVDVNRYLSGIIKYYIGLHVDGE